MLKIFYYSMVIVIGYFLFRERDHVAIDKTLSRDVRKINVCPYVPENKISCQDDKFVGVFTGKRRRTKRAIIDLVPFGYNMDFFDLRRCEHAGLVDTTIVFEQDRLIKGQKKPFLFSECSDPEIICIRDHVPSILAKAVFAGNRLGITMFLIENRFRDKSKVIVDNITKRSDDIWVLQNDGDEIINRDALRHFAWCEVRSSVDMVYAPAISYKYNMHYVHPTKDMLDLPLGPSQRHLGQLRKYLWRMGPTLVRGDVWKSTRTLRKQASSKLPHLGLGAANHFSAPNHPTLKAVRLKATADAKAKEAITNVRTFPESLQFFLKTNMPLGLPMISYLTNITQ